MSNTPEPSRTPQGLAYEGRLLDRPEDDVVDQGAPFDIRTLMTRRGLLTVLGIGGASAVLAACTPSTPAAVTTPLASTTPTPTPSLSATATPTPTPTEALPAGEIPDETAGPYPGDGSNGPDALELSGIVRQDIRTSIGSSEPVPGVPLTFTFRVTDMANGDKPFAGVAVYAWHCDGQGRYSMYTSGVENENWLRGVQIADENGQVSFTSIVPGCYTGRWPHIHFEVYPDAASITDATNAIATSQMALPQSMVEPIYALAEYPDSARNLAELSLASDNVFGEDGGALQLATVGGDISAGFTASLVVRVDTTTAPTGGMMGGPGGGPGGSGPGGGRPSVVRLL